MTPSKQAMTPEQLKAARELLGWSRCRLAMASNLSEHAILVFETSGREIARRPRLRPSVDRLAAIRAALEAAGVEFTNGNAAGVRLKRDGQKSLQPVPTPTSSPNTGLRPGYDDDRH